MRDVRENEKKMPNGMGGLEDEQEVKKEENQFYVAIVELKSESG